MTQQCIVIQIIYWNLLALIKVEKCFYSIANVHFKDININTIRYTNIYKYTLKAKGKQKINRQIYLNINSV